MTQLEAQALVLFKEHTHLELKTVLHGMEMSEEERKIVLLALEYHSAYVSQKLNKTNDTRKRTKA